MNEYFPLLFVGSIVGTFSIVFLVAYLMMKDKKKAIGFERHVSDSEIIKRLFKYAKPHIKTLIFVLVIMVFSIANDIISPIIFGEIEEVIKNKFELSELFLKLALYAFLIIISLVATYVEAIILQKVGMKILSAIREDVFTHIESLSHAQLNSQPVGKLVTRVANDTNAISMMFTNILVNFAKNIFVIFGVLISMLTLNYFLTLVVLCFVPFIILFTVIFRKFARKAYREVKDATTDINTYLSENLSGIKVTQIFNQEQAKFKDFSMRNDRLGKAKNHQIFVFSVFRPMVYMLYISSVLCLLYFGGMGYIKDMNVLGQVVTSGTVVTFYMYLQTFFNPIQNLAEMFNTLQSAFASAEKIFTIFDMQPEIVDSEDAIELTEVKGNIEFKNVWFKYVEDEWVLKDVSFKIDAGDTAAFVGSTGSGKTTILSLIVRDYDIQKGQILIDGIDIKKIKISSLRRHFGQMLQDVFLFSGTIRSNILLNLEGIDDKEIKEVCEYVNADKFINKLEKGLDDEVRERGNNFSAGQRQLLSFARTLIHKPSVMILDEATANIDTETEVLIQNSLEKMMSIGTMLIVAHRLSTVQHADKIFVLSHGVIVEQGNHQELLAMHGKYYSLYTTQTKMINLKQ
ncbi:MAG: ABC transporter ATP-binding protein/permease [Lachnospiraceae bacterium]|nr:ABC transporter ATP-binding protein/permease [Lachnospiraceae bacterium]